MLNFSNIPSWYRCLYKQRACRKAADTSTRTSCYTNFVLKNVTVTLEEKALLWARRKAAEENTSVSRLLGRMIADEMRRSDEYWTAYERWKRIKPVPGAAANRLSREEANVRPKYR